MSFTSSKNVRNLVVVVDHPFNKREDSFMIAQKADFVFMDELMINIYAALEMYGAGIQPGSLKPKDPPLMADYTLDMQMPKEFGLWELGRRGEYGPLPKIELKVVVPRELEKLLKLKRNTYYSSL